MEENKLLYLFKKHWSKLVFVLLAVACASIWGERSFRSRKGQFAQDYIIASQIFERMQLGKYLESESISQVEEIIQRHPELHPKYDTLMAHTFLAQKNTAKALSYAAASFERVSSKLPLFYQDYAHTSFLISEKKYEEAFLQAKKLEASLQLSEEYPHLRTFNLLRILFLAEKRDEHETLQLTWELLKEQPSFKKIGPLFKEGKLSLEDYFAT